MNLVTEYIISMGNLYGLVNKEKVVAIYNMQNENQITLANIEKVIENEIVLLEEHFIFVDGDYFVHETIIVFDGVEESLNTRKGKPFYIPDKRELLKYSDQFYIEKTKEYVALFDFLVLELLNGDEENAEEICEEVQGFCHVEASFTTILNSVNSFVDFQNKQQSLVLMNLVTNLANNTRIWSNNGHTPQELFESNEQQHLRSLPTNFEKEITQSFVNKHIGKIGRNDACPCGSNKKYKKCCM